jgi:hypothetical protein
MRSAVDARAPARRPRRRSDAREAQRCEPDARLRVARLTVELIRPVSVAPISLEVRLIGPGRKVQIVEVVVRQDAIEVALGRALAIRTAPVELPAEAVQGKARLALPAKNTAMATSGAQRAFHSEGAELCFVKGPSSRPVQPRYGCAFACRCCAAGHRRRVVAAADFGNGVSSPLSSATGCSSHQPGPHDPPEARARRRVGGPESRMTAESEGIGISESRLSDETGPSARRSSRF